MIDLPSNYRKIVERIGEAACRAKRKPEDIELLAAAKSQSVESVKVAIAAGIRLIGENYVQEAKDKIGAISQPVEWHMIGHLQRNKAKAAVELFDVIESLDSVALARELSKHGAKHGRVVRAFIEVNLSGEQSKSGIAKNQVKSLLAEMENLPHIRIEGLMTIPPYRENPEAVRPYFRELCELRARLRDVRQANVDLKELSMGMTHDYAVAIEEGATIVRIGTALFGPRSA